jgi:hypothetical protein
MMLTNKIEHYMQQWNYIKIGQAKTKKIRWFIFMFSSDASVTNSHRLSRVAKKIIQNSTKY